MISKEIFQKKLTLLGFIDGIYQSLKSSSFAKEKISPLCAELGKKGAIILSDSRAPGGFDAAIMHGSVTAGVIDVRGRKNLTVLAQKDLLLRSLSMGFSKLVVFYGSVKPPILDGVIYWRDTELDEIACLNNTVKDNVYHFANINE